ncbi:hypothetical protein KP77_09450 [Jeotgalibacillus alimentarius]|uniref:Glutamate-rich protein GrpB n=1 Tax=Jeotgalibacillus alimentarius TaxID=135826 RepID=A0A0C2W5W9_9BACL|nr:GrpB family protein [Jeotgalibacillus alimentarius]KIL51433.1 hypothetical protein KP77_09450 [Jeotgalibacillus alimentarius]
MKVTVQAYNSNWANLFKKEAEKIKVIFGDQLIDIYHIGSTSVPGLHAKPIIDMLPVLKDIKVADQLAHQMERIGYEALGEYGLPGRRYFRKGADKRTHHVHMYDPLSSDEIERHLAVRDYLRQHPEAAAEYGALKVKLAEAYPNHIESYIDGKNDFVQQLEKESVQWKRQQEK